MTRAVFNAFEEMGARIEDNILYSHDLPFEIIVRNVKIEIADCLLQGTLTPAEAQALYKDLPFLA